MKTVVSIIVPNYNHDKFLKERLESIYNQTYSSFEVILLDDCSTDKSIEILELYRNHPKTSSYIINDKNSGSTFLQWDKGLQLAKGEYVWIAESDDFSEPSFLESLLKPFSKSENLALVFCQSNKVNMQGKITGNWISHTENFSDNIFQNNFYMEGNYFIEKYLIHKNVIPNVSAVLFKKEYLDSILPLNFKPFMKYYADWFFYIQLLCNSQVAFVSESLNYFRYHGNSVIAKAGNENGWLNIFKMELQGRDEMINYLKSCGPENLDAIIHQKKIGDNLLIEDHVKRGGFLRTILWIWDKPKFWINIGFVFFRKLTNYS